MEPTTVQQWAFDDAWASEHSRFIHLIFAEFDQTGNWPDLAELQRKIARSGESRDIYAELRELPRTMGWLDQESVVLTVRALSHCELATPLLERFLACLRIALEIYLGDGPAVLRSEDLATRLDLTGLELAQIGKLIDLEGWWFSGGAGSPGGAWQRTIGAQIMQIENVAAVGDYLVAVARVRGLPVDIQPEPPQPTRRRSASPARYARLIMAWQAKREHTIRDLLLVGVLTGVVVFVLARVT